ncbi:hypothetical protein EVAR_93048_1 [Eumeta japonica]|uniref:Uncharacterized protein n=1 Tax=Eumeta variegata TaxID=151549 RepID=A0A4C1TG02_EUMVA|nr:hypothetical protein EVAR_93048_1 [Eumeta japonica]
MYGERQRGEGYKDQTLSRIIRAGSGARRGGGAPGACAAALPVSRIAGVAARGGRGRRGSALSRIIRVGSTPCRPVIKPSLSLAPDIALQIFAALMTARYKKYHTSRIILGLTIAGKRECVRTCVRVNTKLDHPGEMSPVSLEDKAKPLLSLSFGV